MADGGDAVKVLVAGGAGFLGSNLCHRLIDGGDIVYCMDTLSTSSTDNIADLYSANRFHLILANVINPLPEIRVDQIYHLASPTAPGAYQRDPEGTVEANVKGTLNLLRMANIQGAKMLFASSIRVTEPLELESPHSCYVDGKRQAEELCLNYHQIHHVDVKIARLFNTYGPRMAKDDSRVVPTFVRQALRGDPLKIAGDGAQKDSFCYVDDMVDALIAYMNSDIKLGPMEFGYPDPIAILYLAKLVIQVTHSQSVIEFNGVVRSARELEIKRHRPVPDISDAEEKLGWFPVVSLPVGLRLLAEYYEGV